VIASGCLGILHRNLSPVSKVRACVAFRPLLVLIKGNSLLLLACAMASACFFAGDVMQHKVNIQPRHSDQSTAAFHPVWMPNIPTAVRYSKTYIHIHIYSYKCPWSPDFCDPSKVVTLKSCSVPSIGVTLTEM